MSEFQRLKRVVNSWLGGVRIRKKRRVATYQDDDALLILTDLGLLMSPEALVHVLLAHMKDLPSTPPPAATVSLAQKQA